MVYLQELAASRQRRLSTMGTICVRNKKQIREKIVKGEKRDVLIDRIFDSLSAWHYSYFENEGAVRSAVRSAFCLNGYSWPVSDAEADALVQAALNEMGAVRPSWFDGQPERTIGKENCQNYLCSALLTEDQIANGNKFCCDSCYQFARLNREKIIRRHERQAYSNTWYAGWRASSAVERICENHSCGKIYRSPFPQQKYCSHECFNEVQRNPERRRQCENPGCVNVFVDRQSGVRRQRFCSIECKEFGRAVVKLECLQCGNSFEAKATTGRAAPKYCSSDCRIKFNTARTIKKRKAAKTEKIKSAETIHITAEIFDGWFRMAG